MASPLPAEQYEKAVVEPGSGMPCFMLASSRPQAGSVLHGVDGMSVALGKPKTQ